MLKPLREEQADMRSRWSDPAYRWANDSNLRRKFDGHKQTLSESVQSTGSEIKSGAPTEVGKGKEGAQ